MQCDCLQLGRAGTCAVMLLVWALVPGTAMSAVELRQALPALRASEPAVRRIFVEVAVAVLADRFLAAAQASADDDRWARHTRSFVADLWRAVDGVRAGGTVQIIEDPDSSLRIVVSGARNHQFALLPPRPADRAAVEAEIMRNLCLSVDCSYIERSLEVAAPATATARQTTPQLTRGTRATPANDGLSCAPGGGRHARLRASACTRLLREMRALREVLYRSHAGGLELDWSVLDPPLWRKRGSELLVRQDGATVTVDAPLLGRYPALLATVMPWIRAHIDGRVQTLEVAPPARLIYAANRGAAAP